MIQEALSHFPSTLLPLVALGIFLTVFFGVLIWVFRRGTNRTYEKLSRLPLDGASRGEST